MVDVGREDMRSAPVAASNAIGVLVADSNQMQSQLLTSALRRRPEFSVNSVALDHEAILDAVDNEPVHVLVIGAGRGGQPDLTILRRLHFSHAQIEKILLLDSYDRDAVVSAFRSGARGIFCFADYPFRMLCKCIQSVYEGQVWANSEQLQYLVDAVAQVPSLRVVNANGHKLLTLREGQVVALVADGLSNREVARELNLSEHTIKKYLFRVFDKLGISSRVELVLYAVNHGDHREAEWISG